MSCSKRPASRWKSAPALFFSRGGSRFLIHYETGYSYLPVNGLDLPKLLGVPIADTLSFADKATVTDAQTGIVFSAFETGLRVGRKILAIIANTTPQAILTSQK